MGGVDEVCEICVFILPIVPRFLFFHASTNVFGHKDDRACCVSSRILLGISCTRVVLRYIEQLLTLNCGIGVEPHGFDSLSRVDLELLQLSILNMAPYIVKCR